MVYVIGKFSQQKIWFNRLVRQMQFNPKLIKSLSHSEINYVLQIAFQEACVSKPKNMLEWHKN